MKLLIIGGTGFFGPTIVSRALNAGHDVLVYHRNSHDPARDPDVPHLHGSTLEIGEHLADIRSFHPDAAIDTTQFMTETTASVTEALAGVCERYVLVSSADVYRGYGVLHRTESGPPQKMPVDEMAKLRTRPSFDQTDTEDNIFAERAAMGQDFVPTTIVRAPAMFGAGDRVGRVRDPMRRIKESDGVLILATAMADWHFSYGYVDNIADALLLCAEDRRAGHAVYNVGYPEGLSNLKRYRHVADALGWDGEILTSTEVETDATVNYRQDLVIDSSLIRAELQYQDVVAVEEAVKRSVEWELSRTDNR